MDELKAIVIRALIAIGFSESVPLEDRRYQLRIVEYYFVSIWIVVSLLIIWNPKGIFIWVLAVFLSLLAEQIISVVILWIKFHFKFDGLWSNLRESSFFRSPYSRMNLWFALPLMYLTMFLSIQTKNFLALFFFQFLILIISVEDNNFGASLKDYFLSLGLSLERGGRQIASILTSGIGLAAPGLMLAVIVGSISEAIWQLINQLNWLRLSIVLVGLLILIIIPSISTLGRSLNTEMEKNEFDEDLFSPERLYKAVIQSLEYHDAKSISIKNFDSYKEAYSWKWRKRIYSWSRTALIAELKKRAKWHFVFGLILLIPTIFLIMYVSTSILFPQELISQWLGGKPMVSSLSYLFRSIMQEAQLVPGPFWIVAIEDPLVKYSAISTCLLISSFVLNYVQDGRRILSNLGLKARVITEWLTLLCAYYVLYESEFQWAGESRIKIGTSMISPTYIFAPFILLPPKVDEALINRVVSRVQGINLYFSFPCILMMSVGDFLGSGVDVISMGGETNEISIDRNKENSSLAKCWAWIEKKHQATEIREFRNLDDARKWVISNFPDMEGYRRRSNRSFKI